MNSMKKQNQNETINYIIRVYLCSLVVKVIILIRVISVKKY